jgi:LysM repeat protein
MFPAVLLLLGAAFCGCTPSPRSQMSEQKNPYYLAAKERAGAHDFPGAIEAYEKVIHDDPAAVLSHYELGLIYEQQLCDYAAAIHHYNRVLKLRPNGYPADNARIRVPGCKQELAKSELALIAPGTPRELDRLREENQRLLKQLEVLQTQLNARSAGVPNPTRAPFPPVRFVAARTNAPLAAASPAAPDPRSPSNPPPSRTHKVEPGETLASISRKYGLKLDALQSANPGLNPRRMRAGQTLNLP